MQQTSILDLQSQKNKLDQLNTEVDTLKKVSIKKASVKFMGVFHDKGEDRAMGNPERVDGRPDDCYAMDFDVKI